MGTRSWQCLIASLTGVRAPNHSMPNWRLSRRFEIANRKKQRDGCQGDPCKDAEGVHKRQQADLMLELLKDAALRC
jgi:hypothetical protein